MRSKFWFAFLVGLGSFVVAQAVWLLARLYLNEYSMWVFETTAGVTIGGAIIIAACAWMGYRSSSAEVRILGAFYCGAAIGMATTIVWLLPLLGQTSNIWPIALVFNWILLVPVVLVGWALGRIRRKLSLPNQTQPQSPSREA